MKNISRLLLPFMLLCLAACTTETHVIQVPALRDDVGQFADQSKALVDELKDRRDAVEAATDSFRAHTPIRYDLTSLEAPVVNIDWRASDTAIRNQGRRGTCTAFGVLAVMENVAKKKFARDFDLSAEHLWSRYRQPYTQYAIDAAGRGFVVGNDQYPYNPRRSYYKFVNEAQWGLLRADHFDQVGNSLSAVLESLKTGPLVFALDVNESFMNPPTDGFVRADDLSTVGGHALELVAAISTPPNDGYFVLKNSWGKNYGDHGYAKIPFRYCQLHNCYETYALSSDALQMQAQ